MTLETLYAAWSRLGARLSIEPTTEMVWPEDLLISTFAIARDDARLFVMAASWVRQHGDLVDTRLLGRRA